MQEASSRATVDLRRGHRAAAQAALSGRQAALGLLVAGALAMQQQRAAGEGGAASAARLPRMLRSDPIHDRDADAVLRDVRVRAAERAGVQLCFSLGARA